MLTGFMPLAGVDCRVSENTYMVFHQIEMLVRKVFNDQSVQHEMTSDLRESTMKDEDLLFYWCMLTTDVEGEKGIILLSMIVDLYLEIFPLPNPSWSITSKLQKSQHKSQKH